jgi:hypothetical protein
MRTTSPERRCKNIQAGRAVIPALAGRESALRRSCESRTEGKEQCWCSEKPSSSMEQADAPEYCWYGWRGERLAERGYAVDIPHHPGLNVEPIATFLPKVLASHDFDEHTVLVGHSGAPRSSWRS